ncbi:MAG: damage-inducible protein DinB [Gemmatimonadetes bacterium]|nr:damage-inducible protein DinB [Gemmatimonadota bacterium]
MEIPSAESFLAYYGSVRGRTRRVAALIAQDRVEWTHRPGAWTLGDMVRHVAATERWMWGETVQGRPSRYAGCGPELASGRDEVLAYLDRMQDETAAIVAALTPDGLRRPCQTPAGAPLPTWKWLRAMVEHQIHHRGQIYLMLGMLGVPTPPIFGLTSEEVRDRSVGAAAEAG